MGSGDSFYKKNLEETPLVV